MVKANRPKLLAVLKGLPWKDVPGHSATDRGRGRRITRTIKVLQAPTDLPDWAGFPGAAQVAQIRRTRITTTKTGGRKKTVEVVYVITSADHQTPHHRGCWRPGCSITGGSRLCTGCATWTTTKTDARSAPGRGPETMATLRNASISLLRLAGGTNIAAALRHHHAHPDKIITLLTS